jgi:gluconate 2-dehydrogenase alpha chain
VAKKLPHKDVAIIGLGWTGTILANELTDAGLDVVAIERGPWRDTGTDFSITYVQDELRYRIQHELFMRPAQNTVTFRNKTSETPLPVRNWGAFMLGNGVGGAGVHWNAETWRFLPTDFTTRSHLTQRYGAGFLPADMTVQDWGVSYDELEPHYDAFEYLCGTSGQAGNVQGKIQDGGNPFEGVRSRPYPTPPQKQGYGHTLFAEAARQLGYKPFPQPSGNLSQAYTNPLGVTMDNAHSAATASGSAAPITRRPARKRPFCRCLSARTISKAARIAKSRASIWIRPASARPASPMSTRRAMSSSSPPISSCCARFSCGTCSFF